MGNAPKIGEQYLVLLRLFDYIYYKQKEVITHFLKNRKKEVYFYITKVYS